MGRRSGGVGDVVAVVGVVGVVVGVGVEKGERWLMVGRRGGRVKRVLSGGGMVRFGLDEMERGRAGGGLPSWGGAEGELG